MVSARLRCVCCALPPRVIDHVASKAGGEHAARVADHHRTADKIRSDRHASTAAAAPKTKPGQRRRLIYDSAHTEDLPGRLARAEGAAPARDRTVNDAYENVGITLDFYEKVFGRKSLDDAGMDVEASVHYGDAFPNAMWNGERMLFGDGDGVHIGGFARSVDIVAHELTHAVTQHAIPGGLGVVKRHGKYDLTGEPGALNESISDVFACLVKQWHHKQDVKQADWLIGEGILAPNVGRAVRSLRSPGDASQTYEGDDQVADMRGYAEGGDVHRNSGIPSHAFYLAAHSLGGHAWEHAGRIWYDAIGRLQPHSGFRDAAQATLDSAARLFGNASKEQHAVQAAWHKVGVLRA